MARATYSGIADVAHGCCFFSVVDLDVALGSLTSPSTPVMG